MPTPNHDERGRFKPGNQAAVGSGRPSNEYKRAVDKLISGILLDEDTMREAQESFAKRLKKGDLATWQMLLDRGIGPVVQKRELSGPDDGPIVIDVISELTDGDSTATE